MSVSGSNETCIACGSPIRDSVASNQCAACLLELASTADTFDEPDGESLLIQSGVLPEFGDYRLLEEIARGGMGVVYRAEQVSLRRSVAIKMILAGQLATPESIRRFRAEAEAAAKLDHPGIVPIYEVGLHETQHFFSMRLVEGGSLADRIAEFALKANTTSSREQQKRIAQLIHGVAQAIAHAHRHAVLHRDLKPANILLDEEDNPQLTDFGLAKLVGHEASGFTLSSAILGSPSYMAPEQAMGNPDDITTAADVYGLGATLYQLLTGRVPFVGHTALATMQQVLEKEPIRPRSINPQVHPDLETIALKCMEKKPEARYASVSEVADELSRFIDGDPIRARPVGALERAWRWCRRNTAVATLLCVLGLTFIGGFIGVFTQWRRAELTNVRLQASVDRSKWIELAGMTDRDQNFEALAHLSERLRNDPNDWRSAMMAVSILDNRKFARPVCEPITHGDKHPFCRATFSPSGTRFLTAAADGTVRIHDSETGNEVLRVAHGAAITWADFSADGERLLTSSDDQTARVWNAKTGDLIFTTHHDRPVTKALFFGDSKQFATATQNGAIRLWQYDEEHANSPILLAEFGERVRDFDCSSRGRRLVAGSADGRTIVWNISDRQQPAVELARDTQRGLKRVFLSHDESFAVSAGRRVECWRVEDGERTYSEPNVSNFVPTVGNNSARLLTSAGQRATQIIDMTTGRDLSSQISTKYQCFAGAFDPTDQFVATGGWDYSVSIHAVRKTIPEVSPFRVPSVPLAIEFSPDGTRLLAIVGSQQQVTKDPPEDAAVTLWQIREPVARRELDRKEKTFFSAISPDGTLIAAEIGDRLVVLDRELRVVSEKVLTPETLFGIAFTPDSRLLITASASGVVTALDPRMGKTAAGPIKLNETCRTFRLSHDGHTFAAASRFGEVRFLDVETFEVLPVVLEHGGELNDLTFSSDDLLVASASDEHTVKIWELSSGKLLHTLSHDYRVQACKFSPDDSRIVTGSNDFTARIWSTKTGEPIGIPMRHRGEVGNASFSPDGTKLLTSARDGTTRTWDAQTGEPLVPWMMHHTALREANWSPDGRLIVTVDHEALRVWDAESGLPVGVQVRASSASGIGFDSAGARVPFFPDGSAVAWCQTIPRMRICDTRVAPTPVPDWFPDFLQMVSGHTLDQSGSAIPISLSRMIGIREELGNGLEGSDYYRSRVSQTWD